MPATYLIAVVVFDTAHQRSNPLFHAGFVLMKGDEGEGGIISNIEAIGSHGFYTHQVPTEHELSKFKKKLGLHLRWQGSYAELKEEDLKTIDLGFGLKTSKPIKITDAEKDQLLFDVEQQYSRQRRFFQQPDDRALAEVKLQYPDFDPENSDEKNDKAALREFQVNVIKYREIAYENAWSVQDMQQGDLIDETAVASNAITNERARKDFLKNEHGISPFHFHIGSEASTCKLLIIDFLIDSLRCGADHYNDPRLFALSELKSKFYTGAFPRFDDDNSSIIFDTRQKIYASASGSLSAPKREWDDVRNGNASCKLQFLGDHEYISSNGEKKSLSNAKTNPDSLKVLQVIHENLHLVKRMLNSLLLIKSVPGDISSIDSVLDKIIEIGVEANSLGSAMTLYHDTIKSFEQSGVLSALQAAGYDKKIKFETSVEAELPRLKRMISQARKEQELTVGDVVGMGVYESGARYLYQFFERKAVVTVVSQEPPKIINSLMCNK